MAWYLSINGSLTGYKENGDGPLMLASRHVAMDVWLGTFSAAIKMEATMYKRLYLPIEDGQYHLAGRIY